MTPCRLGGVTNCVEPPEPFPDRFQLAKVWLTTHRAKGLTFDEFIADVITRAKRNRGLLDWRLSS